MGSEWNLVRLADCAVFQEGYVNPSQKKSDYFDGPIKWLRAVDLNDGFVYDTTRTLSNEGFNSAGKSALLFKPGTLAISKSGTIGRVGILKDYMCGNRAVINITVDESKCDNRFIFYVLKKNREFFEMMATGSVQKNLYTSVLGSLEFLLPPKVIQENIGNLLGSLDNKIDLNRQINTTLESMAQALFKSWFVDFDPVIDNALAAGNEIPDELAARAARREALRQQTNETTNKTTGATDAASPEQALPETGLSDQRLPCEIQQLFPDRFVLTDEMGWVPEGWEVVDVEHILKRLKVKKRYKKGDVSSSGRTPVYEQGADILLGFNEEEAEIEASVNDPAFIFGDHTCVTRLSTIPFSISENVIALKPSKYDGYWTYHAYRDKQQFEEYRRHWMELIVRPVVVPTPQLASTFGSAVRGYYERSELVMRENTSLEDLRDSLLPKLLSGQITIPDAEQQLAEVL